VPVVSRQQLHQAHQAVDETRSVRCPAARGAEQLPRGFECLVGVQPAVADREGLHVEDGEVVPILASTLLGLLAQASEVLGGQGVVALEMGDNALEGEGQQGRLDPMVRAW
jgi:hypothetical protein